MLLPFSAENIVAKINFSPIQRIILKLQDMEYLVCNTLHEWIKGNHRDTSGCIPEKQDANRCISGTGMHSQYLTLCNIGMHWFFI